MTGPAEQFRINFEFEDGNFADGTPATVFVLSMPPGKLRFPLGQQQMDMFVTAFKMQADRLRGRLILPPGVNGRAE